MLIDSSEVDANSIFATIEKTVNIPNVIQNVILSPVKNIYFPWLCLLLLVSSDNLKRPLLYFAMAHWGINTIGDILYQSIYLYNREIDIFPFGNKIYIYSIGISSVMFLFSEILGDWYLLIRTKVLIRSNKKVLIALITACILYNITKVAEMIVYLRYVPFPTDPETLGNMDLLGKIYEERFGHVIDQRLNCLIFQQITSLIYDILVIVILKKNVFVKNEIGLSNNTFLSKFKQLSEYRIYIGVLIALIAAPFIFVEILLLRNSQENYYNVIYTIRSKLLNFFYIFMYIDQISLKFFVERTNVVRSNYNGNGSTNSKSNHNISNNSNNKSSNTLTYNMSNTSLRSLGNVNNYSNSTINYNNYNAINYSGQTYNNFNSNSDYDFSSQNINGPSNYRYNNYNVINSFNSSTNNTSVSDIFYNKLLHQNQLENDDDRYLIDKQNQYR